MTRGTFLLLCLSIGIAVALPRVQGPGDPAAEGAMPFRAVEPGYREGTWGLSPGSRVTSLSEPELGPGTVVEIKTAARVFFGSNDLLMETTELLSAESSRLDVDPASKAATDSREESPSILGPTLVADFPQFSRVICPARPELGCGMVAKKARIFTVRYASGTQTQTDVQIRPALREAPAPPAAEPHRPESCPTSPGGSGGRTEAPPR
jgi:hypothetical protein